MKNLLRKISGNGIAADTPFALRNKLRVLNNAVLGVFFISLFYCIVALASHFFLAAAVTLYSIASTVFAFVMIRRGRYHLVFHYMMWYGFILITAFSILFGRSNNSYYYFLFMPVVLNILFDRTRVSVFYFVAGTVLMVANVYWINNYDSYYALESWMPFFIYPNILFVCLLIFLGVGVFKQENQAYAARIEEQKSTIEEKNREITDSINYAQKIQSSLIPSEEEFSTFFKDSFVFFRPKDIVSGDFYWVSRRHGKIYFALGDCTGHGVPGGFMTMLGVSFLDHIIDTSAEISLAAMLDSLSKRIITTLKQGGAIGESKDGMDIVLCSYDPATNLLEYAAANNTVYVFSEQKLSELPADKQPCGFHYQVQPFTQRQVKLDPGDCIYLFTDGYPDQFGGAKKKKYKYKQLEEHIAAIQAKAMREQRDELAQTFDNWKGELAQIDDVTVIGIRV